MTLSPLCRIGALCVTLLLMLGGGPALADRDGNGQRLRQPERGEAPREAPRLRPGGLRHRDYDQPIAEPRDRSRPRQPDYDRREAVPAPGRPVNDVIKQVERRYGGRVVGVQQEGAHYRVRVLQRDGRVKTVMMPAN